MIFLKQTTKPKVISFDLDNTLYDCETVLRQAEEWFAGYLSHKYNLGGGQSSDYRFWRDIKSKCLKLNPELAHDVTALRAYGLQAAFDILKIKLTLDEAFALVEIFRNKRSQGHVCSTIKDFLIKLKERYPICLLSNGNCNLEILGLENIFSEDFRPNLNGLKSKPFPDLYNKCAAHYGVGLGSILHVGDDPITDVNGAVDAGCMCAWVYKGYSGISPDEGTVRSLPNIIVKSVLDLEDWLL